MFTITKEQSTSLETLRACSAITVVVAHSFQIFISGYHPREFYYAGLCAQVSVMIFFVLSGLLIGLSINNNIARNDGGFNVIEYAKSRLLRIYPPLIVSLIITICLSFIVISLFGVTSGYSSPHRFLQGYTFSYNAKEYIATLSFTNMFTFRHVGSNGALWSLPLEAWLYFLAALLMMRSWLSIGLAVVLFIILENSNPKFIIYSSVWGISFALSFFIFSDSALKKMTSILLSLLMATLYYILWSPASNTFYNAMYLYAIIGFITLAMIALIIHFNFRITLFNRLASSSYTLYLIHFPILYFFSFLIWKCSDNSKVLHHVAFFISPFIVIYLSHYIAKFPENGKLFLAVFRGKS